MDAKMITPFPEWPEQLRQKRGLLNGKRVQLAREYRGIARYVLARKLGMTASELKKYEQHWNFWTKREEECLLRATDFPIGFFTQDDPPTFDAPMFFCKTDEDGEGHCHVEQEGNAP